MPADVLEVLGVLEAAGIWTSVEGGWGVDALIGEQTREHSDLDLAVVQADADGAQTALRVLGFEHDPVAWPGLPARLVLADPRGRRIDFHPLVFDDRGNGWQELPDGGWCLHEAAYLDHTGAIDGNKVRCIAPTRQLRFQLGYRWTVRDADDMRRLARRFDLPLPPAVT
jgi:lincosamide nucleotidyltransferase A/C/D/E